jgi:chromosomal replication initiator protein
MTPPAGWTFMGPYIVPEQRRPLVREIQARVAAFYHMPLIEMTSARRAREVARPRQVAMYLAKQLTRRSLPEIGKLFGDRDHTTVIHAVRQVERFRADSPEIDAQVAALAGSLGGGA